MQRSPGLLSFTLLLVTILACSGCSYLMFWQDDDDVVESDGSGGENAEQAPTDEESQNVQRATEEELELKMARLWSRVSELEEELYRAKEKVRVLEKGLMLGLMPEELKHGTPYEPPPKKKKKKKAKIEKTQIKPVSMSEQDEAVYRDALAAAHDLFRAGRYGRAIKAYSEIGEKFDAKVNDGMHKYWIARCWFYLREYNIAHQLLSEFTQSFPKSPWIPRARLELARIEMKQGLRETAIANFRRIIEEHPDEAAAEMAKMELRSLERDL